MKALLFLFVSLDSFIYIYNVSWSYPPPIPLAHSPRCSPHLPVTLSPVSFDAWAWATFQRLHPWRKMTVSPQQPPAANGSPAGGGVSWAPPSFMLEGFTWNKSPAGHYCCLLSLSVTARQGPEDTSGPSSPPSCSYSSSPVSEPCREGEGLRSCPS